jgi:hypothetical protein
VLFAAEAGVEDAEEAEATLLAVRLRTEKTHGTLTLPQYFVIMRLMELSQPDNVRHS